MSKETFTALEVRPGNAPHPTTYCYDPERQQYTFFPDDTDYRYVRLDPVEPNVAILSISSWDALFFNPPPNRRWNGTVIYGTFFVVGYDACGNPCSLDTDMVKKYTKLFAEPEVFDLNELFSAMDF